jgi:hypothetical protein
MASWSNTSDRSGTPPTQGLTSRAPTIVVGRYRDFFAWNSSRHLVGSDHNRLPYLCTFLRCGEFFCAGRATHCRLCLSLRLARGNPLHLGHLASETNLGKPETLAPTLRSPAMYRFELSARECFPPYAQCSSSMAESREHGSAFRRGSNDGCASPSHHAHNHLKYKDYHIIPELPTLSATESRAIG